jgi:hypothetical protein
MNIIIKQGATKPVEFKHFNDVALQIPHDLTGATARLWFGTDLDTPIPTMEYAIGSGLTLLTNTITATISPANTNAVIFDGNVLTGVYQLEVTLSGVTSRTFEGTFTLTKRLD